MPSLLPSGKQSYTSATGAPLVGGKVFTYDAGTNIPRPTYQDADGTVPNTNPVILDSRGEAAIFGTGSYKLVLKDAQDVTQWTMDNVSPSASSSSSGTGTGTGTGTALLPATILAMVAAATAAANQSATDTRDPTPPPKPAGFTVTPGVLQAAAAWTKANYTQGKGPGRVLFYVADWGSTTATTPPADSAAQLLSGTEGLADHALLIVAPEKKLRLWIAFESSDGYEGPKSDPVDIVTSALPTTALGNSQLDATNISAALAMGQLNMDPTFAAGAAVWGANFQRRLNSTSGSAPAGGPVEYVAEFTGRDSISLRPFQVVPGEVYLVDGWGNNVATGLSVGLILTAYRADGTVIETVAPSGASLTPTANTWTRLKGSYTVPANAVKMAVGMRIGQASNGTAKAWFANVRAQRVIDSDLIVNGAVVAAMVSAQGLAAMDARIGSATIQSAQITGTLNANQINTNGLTIKTSSGSVILGENTKLLGAFLADGAVTGIHPARSTSTTSATLTNGQTSVTVNTPLTTTQATADNAVVSATLLLDAGFGIKQTATDDIQYASVQVSFEVRTGGGALITSGIQAHIVPMFKGTAPFDHPGRLTAVMPMTFKVVNGAVGFACRATVTAVFIKADGTQHVGAVSSAVINASLSQQSMENKV